MQISMRAILVTTFSLLLAAGNVWAAKEEKVNEYPNATRKDPKLEMSSGNQKDLNKALDLVNSNPYDEATPILQKVLTIPRQASTPTRWRWSPGSGGQRQTGRCHCDRQVQGNLRTRCAAEQPAVPGVVQHGDHPAAIGEVRGLA
jgi:hypothetical protein